MCHPSASLRTSLLTSWRRLCRGCSRCPCVTERTLSMPLGVPSHLIMLTFCLLCLCLMPCRRTFHQHHALPLFRSIYTWLSVVTLLRSIHHLRQFPPVRTVCRISTFLASVTYFELLYSLSSLYWLPSV
ncbi:hypothetical protein C8R47DRAFT_168278 [Mycena vitilis]|nr:hypothetical protein C8R47DRAFT_168278 [Mycena vitilis]